MDTKNETKRRDKSLNKKSVKSDLKIESTSMSREWITEKIMDMDGTRKAKDFMI